MYSMDTDRFASFASSGGVGPSAAAADDLRHHNVRLAQEVELLKQRLSASRGPSPSPTASQAAQAQSSYTPHYSVLDGSVAYARHAATSSSYGSYGAGNSGPPISLGGGTLSPPLNTSAAAAATAESPTRSAVLAAAAAALAASAAQQSGAEQEKERDISPNARAHSSFSFPLSAADGGGRGAAETVFTNYRADSTGGSRMYGLNSSAAVATTMGPPLGGSSGRRPTLPFPPTSATINTTNAESLMNMSSVAADGANVSGASGSGVNRRGGHSEGESHNQNSSAALASAAALEAQVMRYRSRMVALEAEVEEKNALLLAAEAAARTAHDANALKLKTLEGRVAAAADAAEAQRSELMAKLSAAEAAVRSLTASNEALAAERAALRKSAAATEGAVAAAKGRQMEAEAALGAYGGERESLQQRIAVLTTDNSALQQLRRECEGLRGLREDCAALQGSLEDAEREIASERTKRREGERQQFQLEQRLSDAEAKGRRLEADLRGSLAASAERDAARRELEASEAANAVLREEVEGLRRAAEGHRRAAAEAAEERDRVLEAAQGQLLRLRQDIQHCFLDAEEAAGRALLLQQRADASLGSSAAESGGGGGGESIGTRGLRASALPTASEMGSAAVTRAFMERLEATLRGTAEGGGDYGAVGPRAAGQQQKAAEGIAGLNASRTHSQAHLHTSSHSHNSHHSHSYALNSSNSATALNASNSANNGARAAAHHNSESRVTSPMRRPGSGGGGGGMGAATNNLPLGPHTTAGVAPAVALLAASSAGSSSVPSAPHSQIADAPLRPLYAGIRALAADILGALYTEKTVRGQRLAAEALAAKGSAASLNDLVGRLTDELNANVGKIAALESALADARRSGARSVDDNRFLRELTFSKMKFLFENLKTLQPSSSADSQSEADDVRVRGAMLSSAVGGKVDTPRWVDIINMTAALTAADGSNTNTSTVRVADGTVATTTPSAGIDGASAGPYDANSPYASSAALVRLLGEEALAAHLKTAAAAGRASRLLNSTKNKNNASASDSAASSSALHSAAAAPPLPPVTAFTDRTWRYLWDHLSEGFIEAAEASAATSQQNAALHEKVQTLTEAVAAQRARGEAALRRAESAHAEHIANLHSTHEAELKSLQRTLAKSREAARQNAEAATVSLPATAAALRDARAKYCRLYDDVEAMRGVEARRRGCVAAMQSDLDAAAAAAEASSEDSAALAAALLDAQQRLSEEAAVARRLGDGLVAFVRVAALLRAHLCVVIAERNAMGRRCGGLEAALADVEGAVLNHASAAAALVVSGGNGTNNDDADYIGGGGASRHLVPSSSSFPLLPAIKYRSVSSVRVPAIALIALRRLLVLSAERRRRGVSLLPVANTVDAEGGGPSHRGQRAVAVRGGASANSVASSSSKFSGAAASRRRSVSAAASDVYDEDEDTPRYDAHTSMRDKRTLNHSSSVASEAANASMAELRADLSRAARPLPVATLNSVGSSASLSQPAASSLALLPTVRVPPRELLAATDRHRAVGTYANAVLLVSSDPVAAGDADDYEDGEYEDGNHQQHSANSLFEVDRSPSSLLMRIARACGAWRSRMPHYRRNTTLLSLQPRATLGVAQSSGESASSGAYVCLRLKRNGKGASISSSMASTAPTEAFMGLTRILRASTERSAAAHSALRAAVAASRAELTEVATALISQTELRNSAEAAADSLRARVDSGEWVEASLLSLLQSQHERLKARVRLEEATRRACESRLHALVGREVSLLDDQSAMLHKMRSLALALAEERNAQRSAKGAAGADVPVASAAALLGDRFASYAVPEPIGGGGKTAAAIVTPPPSPERSLGGYGGASTHEDAGEEPERRVGVPITTVPPRLDDARGGGEGPSLVASKTQLLDETNAVTHRNISAPLHRGGQGGREGTFPGVSIGVTVSGQIPPLAPPVARRRPSDPSAASSTPSAPTATVRSSSTPPMTTASAGAASMPSVSVYGGGGRIEEDDALTEVSAATPTPTASPYASADATPARSEADGGALPQSTSHADGSALLFGGNRAGVGGYSSARDELDHVHSYPTYPSAFDGSSAASLLAASANRQSAAYARLLSAAVSELSGGASNANSSLQAKPSAASPSSSVPSQASALNSSGMGIPAPAHSGASAANANLFSVSPAAAVSPAIAIGVSSSGGADEQGTTADIFAHLDPTAMEGISPSLAAFLRERAAHAQPSSIRPLSATTNAAAPALPSIDVRPRSVAPHSLFPQSALKQTAPAAVQQHFSGEHNRSIGSATLQQSAINSSAHHAGVPAPPSADSSVVSAMPNVSRVGREGERGGEGALSSANTSIGGAPRGSGGGSDRDGLFRLIGDLDARLKTALS